MRILLVGLDGAGKTSIVNHLKFGEQQAIKPTQGFNINTIDFNDSKYTVWEVGGDEETRKTWKQYTQNTQGLVFVFDAANASRTEEAKSEMQGLLSEPNLANVPLLFYANKMDQEAGQQNLQDIIHNLQLDNIQDREWNIQGCEAVNGIGINKGFDWISKTIFQLRGKMSFCFEAEPKVVKMRNKYKTPQEQDAPSSKAQQTFNTLMQEKRVKIMNPVQQEQEYVRLEKERIKIENMHSQLANFNKKRGKMTPYDIKPSPNPRIEVNLEFFLTDNQNNIEPQKTTIDCQTDAFHQRPISPPYVPKKTGIDAETQVEDYELFDFDREVTPICDIITTKTLEQSMLEIEQEEEIIAMKKYKQQFLERRMSYKEKSKQILEKEIDKIKAKEEMIEKYQEKEQRKKLTLIRVQSYGVGGCYLKNLQQNCFESLYTNGFYPCDLQNQLRTKFLDWMVEETVKQIEIRTQVNENLVGLFDKSCLPSIESKRKPIDNIREVKKKRQAKRRFNQQKNKKMVRLFYYEYTKPTDFAFFYQKYYEGTLEEFLKNKETRLEQLAEQVNENQIQEEEKIKIVEQEFPNVNPGYFGFSINRIRKLGFTLSHNPFYDQMSDQKFFSLEVLCLNKEGQIIYEMSKPDGDCKKNGKFIKYKTNIRDHTLKMSNDEAIIINTSKIPEEYQGLIFLVKIPKLQYLSTITEQLALATYGFEDYEYNIPVDNIELKEFQIPEMIRTVEEETPSEQTAYVVAYSMTRRNVVGWFYENIKVPSKGLINADEIKDYKNQLCALWANKDIGVKKPPKEEGEDSSIKEDHQSSMAASMVEVTALHSKVYSAFEMELKEEETEEYFKEQVENLTKMVEKEDKELISTFTNGMEFYARGKLLAKTKQVKRAKNCMQFEVRRKPDEPEVKEEENPEGEENQEQQEEPDQE